ncbi:WD40 repeat domain-containing protein [Streptomyces sp. NPDC002467]|uniref:WD40 repeat domain-containing protein n=1 Tax=Streptomyces sp. NPDC002467 TaxID=3364647 RepID=UPI0036BB800C
MASSDTTGSYAELLREQTRELTALRVRAGNPSLRDIEKRARRLFTGEKTSLPPATLSGILNGGYAGRDKLLCLVRTLMTWDRARSTCAPPAYGDPVLDVWHDRWEAITKARPPRQRTHGAPAGDPAVEVEPPAPPGVPLQAASEQAPALPVGVPDRFGEVGILTTAQNPVAALAVSPDNTLLAAGCGDGRVRLWNAVTRQRIHKTLTGHKNRPGYGPGVYSVAFSPDGTLVAGGGTDGAVLLWNTATRRPHGQPLEGPPCDILSIAFSPDGSLLAAGDSKGRLRLWNPVTCQPIGKPLSGHRDSVAAVAFSPDGALLATGGSDFTLQLWNPATRRPRGQPLRTRPFAIRCMGFSPDGSLLAVGTGYGTVELWDPATRRLLETLTSHKSAAVEALAFSPDRAILATAGYGGIPLPSGGYDNRLRLWNTTTHRRVGRSLTGHTAGISAVAFSPDGNLLATGSRDCTVRLYSKTSPTS